ncbi:MAG: hypothetical protein ACTHKY_15280, partial [Ginsengibacter sp.]
MGYNVAKKLSENILAVDAALRWDDGQTLTPVDFENLKRYSGFGGIKAILYPYGPVEEWQKNGVARADIILHETINQFHDLLKSYYSETAYKEAVASLRNSVLTAFYTPEIVPQTLYKVLSEQLVQPKRLYEPSAGSGVFISEAVTTFPQIEQITAIEKDKITGLVLSAMNSALPVKTTTHIT